MLIIVSIAYFKSIFYDTFQLYVLVFNLRIVLVQERIESVKAGILGAFVFSIAYFFTKIVNFFFNNISSEINIFNLIIPIATGFLFAVTYRYIIRNDQNPHLKDGAVLAFAIIRTLGLETSFDNLIVLFILGIENIFCFLITRYSLDLALKNNLLKYFS